MPVRRRLTAFGKTTPGFATKYDPEFLKAFQEICRIYAAADFKHPEIQVLVLALDNRLFPCRADQFNVAIVTRLAGGIF